MPLQQTSSEPVIQLYPDDSEHPALQVSGIALNSDMTAEGEAVAFVRATLDDGTERILVLYAVSPDQVESMASNQDKRNAIANAIQAQAETL